MNNTNYYNWNEIIFNSKITDVFLRENNITHYRLSTSQQEEMQLVKDAQQNLQSFAVLYERYFDKIYKFFHFRVRHDEDAQDLTASTFEKAVKKLNSFEDQGHPFSTWLFRIAHNTLIDHFREHDRKKKSSLDDLPPSEQPYTELDPSLIDNEQALEKIREIIADLPQLHQDVWALKLNGDLSNKEIAAALNITANNVNVILFRSLAVIKNKIARYRF